MVAQGHSNIKGEIYVIRDPLNILLTLLIALIATFLIYLMNCNYFAGTGFEIADLVAGNVFLLFIIFRLKAVWSGIVINFNDGTITFPGGKVSPNNVIDYLKPSFIFQYFGRKSINADDISQIAEKSRWGHRFFGFKLFENKMYWGLNLIGTFGGATIWFMNEDKCDEAYNAIRQINHMGFPVTDA